MTTTIALSPDLLETLRHEADRSGLTVEAIVNDWLRQHRAELRRQHLAEQTGRFWAKYAEFYAQYPDEYVAFYDDAILDHDRDPRALALRVQAAHADLPIVIAEVTQRPTREYKMISSHLAESLQGKSNRHMDSWSPIDQRIV
jgi:hypothetical protein